LTAQSQRGVPARLVTTKRLSLRCAEASMRPITRRAPGDAEEPVA
jgi:hypothetical protein